MRRFVFSALAGLAAASASGIAASQAWVREYVAGLTGGTNDTVTVLSEDGRAVTLAYEPYSEAGLMATNSANAAVADGTLFAWDGAGRYVNAKAGLAVVATATNFVFGAAQSSVVGGIDVFSDADGGAFGVVSRPLTPSEAAALLEEGGVK